MSQHFRFYFRPLFKFRTDPKYGFADEFIVLVDKIPYEQKTVGSNLEQKGFTYISKYKYRLLVDLWLVKLCFRWVGRERDAKA